MKRIVLVPVSSRIEPSVELALRELEVKGWTVWRRYGYSAIDYARSALASEAIDAGYEEILFVDSDVMFDPESVEQLSSITWTMYERSKFKEYSTRPLDYFGFDKPGVIGGIYAKKTVRDFACALPKNISSISLGQNGDLLRVSLVGTGFLLVRSWAYHLIQQRLKLPVCKIRESNKRLVPYYLPMVIVEPSGQSTYLCEDYAFCERCNMCGIPIIIDTRIRLFHIGSYGYSWEDIGAPIVRFEGFDLYYQNIPRT